MQKKLLSSLLVVLSLLCSVKAEVRVPRVLDDRLKIELFATEPQIVTPTGIMVNDLGHVLVIESHTHFREENYKGPSSDRIRRFIDTDKDGKADRITTFFEGTSHTMSLASMHDGSVLVATRSEIFRLIDNKIDGNADSRQIIIRLDTRGDYPHNGLSGFAEDISGNIFFGMGENLGFDYKLIGSDGKTLSGGGEGGSIYRCKSDGSELQRLATGFWNPFHLCLDVYGRLFAVDNDPDWRPPCRLLHIVPGGDYGYRFSNGRRGLHPFTSWFGEVPGTLGIVAGTGEAPSGMIAYESDGLPEDYRGNLLVTSWGNHAIERFVLKKHGATFRSKAEPIIKGDIDFRPVGIALAPDGSLYISDWVKRSYNTHGHGRIWRISSADKQTGPRPTDPKKALFSKHLPLREKAAGTLLNQSSSGRRFLRNQLRSSNDPTVRALALSALATKGNVPNEVFSDPSADVRRLAVSLLPDESIDAAQLVKVSKSPEESAVALRRCTTTGNLQIVSSYLSSEDPFLRLAARSCIQNTAAFEDILKINLPNDPIGREEIALILRHADDSRAESKIPELLKDTNPRVRFVAIRWIGEEKLVQYRQHIMDLLSTGKMSGKLLEPSLAALDLLDGGKPADFEKRSQDVISKLLLQENVAPPVVRLALRKLPAAHSILTADRLRNYLNHSDPKVSLEAIRSWGLGSLPERVAVLQKIARDKSRPISHRAVAISGLSPFDPDSKKELFSLAFGNDRTLQKEALRSLQGARFSVTEKRQLQTLKTVSTDFSQMVDRLLADDWIPDHRPPVNNINRWDSQLAKGDVSSGERIFFHSQGPKCFTCHQVDGRGGDIGPDLSTIGRLSRQRIIESIITPAKEVAPQFVPWAVLTEEGKSFSGILVTERGNGEQIYADDQGKLIHLNQEQIALRKPLTTSIMPDGMADLMTGQELSDLIAYLQNLR